MTEKKAKAPRQKQIKLKDLEKQFNDLNKFSTFTIDPQKNLVVKYNERFDEDKIDALLQEAYENYMYAEEKDLIFFEDDGKFIKYILFLVSVRFTHFDSEVSHSLEDQIPVFNYFVSTGLFRVMHEEMFDGAEVSKVLNRLDKMNQVVSKIAGVEAEHLKNVEKKTKTLKVLKKKSEENAVQESE